MTGLFRFVHDDSRWKFFCLTGIGIIAIAYFPALSPVPTKESLQPYPHAATSSRSPRPPMTSHQIEQARLTLIREGFSPMHADTVLSTVPHSKAEFATFP